MREKTKADWARTTRNLLKSELTRRGISYEDLAARLKQIGVHETSHNITNKINRGTFSALFMVQVLRAIGCRSLDIHVD